MCSLKLNFSIINNIKHQSMEEKLTSLYTTKFPTKFHWVTHTTPLISLLCLSLLYVFHHGRILQYLASKCYPPLLNLILVFLLQKQPFYINQILIMLFHCLGKTKHLQPKGDPLTLVLDSTPPTLGLTTNILKNNMYIGHKKTLNMCQMSIPIYI